MMPDTWVPTATFVTGSIFPVLETRYSTSPRSTVANRYLGAPSPDRVRQ